ncbi:MAG: hypothetical protein JWN49_679, partial [Parcubacteria group bacterium]|nr:hypothetical protein [Parcubacteria group bacterium]MDB5245599.1 hypothetical protein [Parcubacteria group bacterium]
MEMSKIKALAREFPFLARYLDLGRIWNCRVSPWDRNLMSEKAWE